MTSGHDPPPPLGERAAGLFERSRPVGGFKHVELVNQFIVNVERGEPATFGMISAGVNIEPTRPFYQLSGLDVGERKRNRVTGQNQLVLKVRLRFTVKGIANPAALFRGLLRNCERGVDARVDQPDIA